MLVLIVILLYSTVKATFDVTATRPWEYQRTYITVRDNNTAKQYKLAVTYAVPIPVNQTPESLPVLMEYLPYRKDDSEYPIRYNYFDYFASRGFVYAYVDIRGTGGSEGQRIPYEYSDVETEDGIQIIQALATMQWSVVSNTKTVRSNGKVALWGQSWSAFNAFIIAGKKARDPRLAALQTIVPIHGAVNLYEGDLHYMDGIFHEDEYILSVDHENALPSYGFNGAGSIDAYKFDDDYLANRWNATPWTFFYLGKQLKDAFWTQRTAFFNGPFTRTNPDDFAMPVFVIGSLLDGYRDAPIAIYEKLKAKNVRVKLAMTPSTHTLMDYAVPGPIWEWRGEVAKWLYYWLVDQSDDSLIAQNEFAIYVRQPGDDAKNVPGYWRNQQWPSGVPPVKLYLTADHRLSTTLPAPGTSVLHNLDYKPVVGTQMGVWWGEAALGDMAPLDADALVYDLTMSQDLEMVGFPVLNFVASATSTENLTQLLAQWHVRLEDIAPNGVVTHVTGASLNGAYRNGNPPSNLVSGRLYNLQVQLHFTTWTFQSNHKLRIAITNALYRMMWPSPHRFFSSLNVSFANTFLSLPLVPALAPPATAHPYTSENKAPYTEPSDGWYFAEGGYPYYYNTTDDPVSQRRIVTWNSSYYSNCYGWIVSVELDWQFSQSATNPADTTWTCYARQIYDYVGVTNQQYWSQLYGYPSLAKPGNNVPAPLRSFTLQTWMKVWSNVTTFSAGLQRTLTRTDGSPLSFNTSATFARLFQ
jgi:uncharacterized protein